SHGKVWLRKQPLDLVALVRATSQDYQNILAATELALELKLPDGPLWVMPDPTRPSQVLGTLLHNPSKFTPTGGRVTVQVTAEGGPAVVTVRDTGIGMQPETLARLFQSFSQVDPDRDRGLSGLGLGLALVKGLVELHGGQVQAASEGLGRGSLF